MSKDRIICERTWWNCSGETPPLPAPFACDDEGFSSPESSESSTEEAKSLSIRSSDCRHCSCCAVFTAGCCGGVFDGEMPES